VTAAPVAAPAPAPITVPFWAFDMLSQLAHPDIAVSAAAAAIDLHSAI
jgi:hypothetical protein